MDKFIKRTIWEDIIADLNKPEITVLLGPRQVGKTTLITNIITHLITKLNIDKNNIFYYNLDNIDIRSEIKKSFLFIQKDIELKIGKTLREIKHKICLFIDESQKSPEIFEFTKLIYDSHLPVKIVLTGSSSLQIRNKSSESLSGRTHFFYLYPFTFTEIIGKNYKIYETIENIHDFSRIKEIAAEGYRHKEKYDLFIQKVLFSGSLPKVFLTDDKNALIYLNNFLSTYLDRDIKDIGAKINLENFNLSFKYLTEYCSDLFNYSKMSSDLGIKRDTLYSYLDLLQKTLIIKTIQPFIFPQLKNIYKSNKLYFFDNGVVNRIQGYISLSELKRAKFIGKMFENYIFQNIYAKILNDYKKPELYFFRDYQNHEIDFIYKRGEITIPIEVTYAEKISLQKLKNFARFFSYTKQAKYGIVYYLGIPQVFTLNINKVYALPYFLV